MAFEHILRRGFSPLALVLVAVAAYYQARGLTQLLAMKLLGGSAPTRRSESSPPRSRAVRVGDGVAGKQVAFIGFNPKQQAPAVWLEGRGAFCQCMLFREQAQPAAPHDADSSTATTFNVDRSLVNRGLQGPLSVLGPVRVLPEQRDGKLLGLRLFGIRPGSLLGTLGLQNGDRLESINGFSVASPAQALEAYAHLREAPRLRVQLERSKRPVELNLNIN